MGFGIEKQITQEECKHINIEVKSFCLPLKGKCTDCDLDVSKIWSSKKKKDVANADS